MEYIKNWYTQKLDEAEYNRYMLMIAILLVQGCILTPVAGFLLPMNGLAMGISIVLAFSTIVASIAQIPMKVLIPVFLLSAFSNIVLIFVHLVL